MSNSDFGLIGLAVMGQNLVLNVESRGFQVSVYNRTTSVTDEFVGKHPDKKLFGAQSLEDFVQSLASPRKIMIMVKAGGPVDAVIESLIPLLDQGDIIIDGGNSLYTDTERRDKWLGDLGFRFIGAGVSGGEEGARKGPSIMPGGPASTWEVMKPIFESIAAKAEGEPCVFHIGPGGAGHYVKMIHNGIEYGDMQLICEAYNIFKAAGFTPDELAEVFTEWNNGDLESYLIQITAEIFKQKDKKTKKPLVDLILDTAGQKGTGKWTVTSALDLGVPLTLIGEAVFSRCLSAQKAERVAASAVLKGPESPYSGNPQQFVDDVENALYASKIISYAQGYALMDAMAKESNWSINKGGVALMWRGGCIIRSVFLGKIKEAFDRDPNLANLLLDPFFAAEIQKAQAGWRRVLAAAVTHGVPVPAISSALAYFDGYRSARLPANLLQAQRDYFGAHTYERTDKPGTFHTEWLDLRRPVG
jgi:6-phosphogluconate dehydrogenase